jgi:hypothetical protein
MSYVIIAAMQSDPAPAITETLSLKSDLTFGDGFRFGCGFMAAVIIFWIALILLSGVIAGLAYLIAPGLSNLLIR